MDIINKYLRGNNINIITDRNCGISKSAAKWNGYGFYVPKKGKNMKKIIITLLLLSSLVVGDANAGFLGISIVAHSSGALIATGSSGYIAGSMGVLAAAGPLGWVGAGLIGAALIIL